MFFNKLLPACLMTVGIWFLGCHENEVSFFVEHMKAPPSPPNCTTTAGDAYVSSGLLDLAFRNSYSNSFLVRNSLMGREDYKNIRSESNGILIEGVEVTVTSERGEVLGDGTDYYIAENYLEPESEDVFDGVVIPSTIVDQIAAAEGCRALVYDNYPPMVGDQVDTAGQITPESRTIQVVYASVRFLGRTNAGQNVETQAFTIPIELCCGCLVNWQPCVDSLCERYCEEPEETGMCIPGVGAGEGTFDCRNMYVGINSWQGNCVDESGNPRMCTCDDCSGN